MIDAAKTSAGTKVWAHHSSATFEATVVGTGEDDHTVKVSPDGERYKDLFGSELTVHEYNVDLKETW